MKSKIFDFSNNAFDVWHDVIAFLRVIMPNGKMIEISEYKKTRSNQQNRALRLYWKLLAENLNNEGHTYLSRHGKELKFTSFKIESEWRETQQEMYGIESTTELTTEMINHIYDCMNLDYSLKYGIHQEFPNWQSFINKIDKNEYENN